MLNELLAGLWTNVHSVEQTSIRLNPSDTLQHHHTVLLQNGVWLWCGLLAEKASAVLDESSFKSFGGRLLALPAAILTDPRGLYFFLESLDEVDDVVTSTISSVDSRFKAETLHLELHRVLQERLPLVWRAVSPLISALLRADLDVSAVRFLRQLTNLLARVHIDRADLLASSVSDFVMSEELAYAETFVQRARLSSYVNLTLEMRSALDEVIHGFNMDVPLPKHGPGAVSERHVKTRLGKYLNMGFDSRIDYMLLRTTGERMTDYCPFDLAESNRTCRAIFVPKSWKKLRGISAEPTGLQFFQQAVLRGMKDCLAKSSLSPHIKLRKQQLSGKMALRASRDGTLATIDLSAASDSVTTQLVKDVFGNSHLCRWLLATRSTHVSIGEEAVRMYKFAPMGSATCFPTQCLLFLAVVLVAARRSGYTRVNSQNVRIYGDDIICPASISSMVMDLLVQLGFTVNSSKSYWIGDYRESCGVDAWLGFDVTPLKIKDFSFDFNGASPCSYEHHSRIVQYLNALYARGFKHIRSFLLKRFLACKVHLRASAKSISHSVLCGDGSSGSLYSPTPTNFNLLRLPLEGLQRGGFVMVGWRPRADNLDPGSKRLMDEVYYFEFLLSRRAKKDPVPVSYDLAFFKSLDVRAPDYRGKQMIPTYRLHDKWYPQ